MDLYSALIVGVALAFGGLLKGATGAGTPVIAVPVIAAFFDVRLAVAVLSLPNLCTNLWQMHTYRHHRLDPGWTARFIIAGAIGAVAGTYLLAVVHERVLVFVLAVIITCYILLRLLRPQLKVSESVGRRLAAPVGLIGGLLQGAAGISAPVSVSYLNAMRLDRPVFIFTISCFFAAMSVVQLPALGVAGLLSPQLLLVSLLALVPLLLAIPVGSLAARWLSPRGFDILILLLLSGLAVRLFASALLA